VQALKFESAVNDQRSSRSATNAISYEDSGLTDFLITRGVQNPILGNRLYWYLMVEVALEDKVTAKMYGRVVFKFMNKILEVPLLVNHEFPDELMINLVGRWFRAPRGYEKTRSSSRDTGKTST